MAEQQCPDEPDERDFYQILRERLRKWLSSDEGKKSKWAEYLLFAPDLLHLLCKLTIDREVSAKDKALLAVAIAYFVSPIDMIPEAFVGPIGYVDDIALAAYVLKRIVNNSSQEVVRRHWAGDEDVLDVIKRILEVADEMVGTGAWKKLKKLLKND